MLECLKDLLVSQLSFLFQRMRKRERKKISSKTSKPWIFGCLDNNIGRVIFLESSMYLFSNCCFEYLLWNKLIQYQYEIAIFLMVNLTVSTAIYLLRVNNGNTWKMWEICSNRTIKPPERGQWCWLPCENLCSLILINFMKV